MSKRAKLAFGAARCPPMPTDDLPCATPATRVAMMTEVAFIVVGRRNGLVLSDEGSAHIYGSLQRAGVQIQ